LAFAQEMPGHDVGVMLEHAEHDLVARLHPRRRPAVGDEVDALGGAGGEDDLLGVGCAEEAGDDAAHRLVFLGGDVREIVQAAVDIGVFVLVGPRHRLDHHARLLRRGAVVEVDERLAVHLAREDREIGADFGNVVHGRAFQTTGRIPSSERSRASAKTTATNPATSPRKTRMRFRNPCSSATAFTTIQTNQASTARTRTAPSGGRMTMTTSSAVCATALRHSTQATTRSASAKVPCPPNRWPMTAMAAAAISRDSPCAGIPTKGSP